MSSSGRIRATLAVLALAISAIAFTAAPASAATAEMGAISEISYTSAHITGKVTTSGSFGLYSFEYSTDEADWKTGLSGSYLGVANNKTVQGTVSVPKGGTDYFVRLNVSSADGSAISPAVSPYPSFTTLTVDPPVITATDDASKVFSTSATVSGKVKRPANSDPAFDVKWCFEYVTDAQFTATGFQGATKVPCDGNLIEKPGEERPVFATLTGLSPSTTYHLRISAENAGPGVVTREAAHAFTTLPPVAKPVVLAAGDAFEVDKRLAKASGEIERPAGTDPALDVNCRFEYVTDEQFTATGFEGASSTDCTQNPIGTSGPSVVTAELGRTADPYALGTLTPNTTYHLRLAAENGGGTVTKEVANTFTTVAVIHPLLTADPVTEVGYTSAHVTGVVDPGNQGVVPAFQWAIDPDTEGWTNSPEIDPGNYTPPGAPAKPIFKDITGLKPGTTYKVRLDGYDYEEFLRYPTAEPYEQFTTKGTNTPPSVTLDPVIGITATTAHFSATVDTRAPAGPLSDEGKATYKTDWHFECTPECPENPDLSGTVSAEEGSRALSVDATRLDVNAYYEVKLIAKNVLGTVETDVRDFQTPVILPSVEYSPGGSDGEGGYYLQSVIIPNNSKITDCHFAYGPTATYVYRADCSPVPTGGDEVQQIDVDATEGQFKLSFRGQTTGDIAFDATPATVEAELKALSSIGPSDINVTGSPKSYVVTFNGGPLAGSSVGAIRAKDGTVPLGGGGGVNVSASVEGGNNNPVTVEAHVTGLTAGATYHVQLFATNVVGTKGSGDAEFTPTLAPGKGSCENETLREENSSLTLPECRAFEQVTPPTKQGSGATLYDYGNDGSVFYESGATNLANSGTGVSGHNFYTAIRTGADWETIPNLNGVDGSHFAGNGNTLALGSYNFMVHSADLRSTVRPAQDYEDKFYDRSYIFLRRPDGTWAAISKDVEADMWSYAASSGDLSHTVFAPAQFSSLHQISEYIGIGNPPRRVDVDNSENPVAATCGDSSGSFNRISGDGRVIFFTACGQVWARVDGSTSYKASASLCIRTAGDSGGTCNAPATAVFEGSSSDGSRVFFATTQQLLDGDTDQTSDLYVCDIPPGTPAAVGPANPCADLTQISGARSGADVENVTRISDDGSTVYFVAKGVLTANEDALGNPAVAGDKNLYVWRKDAAHPTGQTIFVGRLKTGVRAETTANGRYLVLASATRFVPTDGDSSQDVYRYDAETGEMIRVSTKIFGVGGNANFDAGIANSREHRSHPAVSSNGAVVFTTDEALSPADGNGSRDVYLWSAGKVFLIGPGGSSPGDEGGSAVIDDSGENIYFNSDAQLAASDRDFATDVYDARVGGGFSVDEPNCSGEACQAPAPAPPVSRPPSTSGPAGPGNGSASSKCAQGKVKKHGKCVKKQAKKHHKQRASHKKGGGK